PGPNPKAAARPRARIELAPKSRCSLAHADQATPAAGTLRRDGLDAVIDDLDLDLSRAVRDGDLGARGPSMANHVGKRLLDDPIRGKVYAARQAPRLAADLESNVQSRGARLGDDGVELGEAWRRCDRFRFIDLAQEGQRRTDLSQCLVTPLLDCHERGSCLFGVPVEQGGSGTGLER